MEARVGGRTYWGAGSRVCDVCEGLTAAVFFCLADTAFLCGACDARVHGVNKLSSRHERVLLCEVCEQSPAAVICKADAAALCVSCDADIHSANSLSSRHQRVPAVPFFESRVSTTVGTDSLYFSGDGEADDCNGDTEADAASWLLQEPEKDPPLEMGKSADCFFSEADSYLDLEYTSSVDAGIYQADRIVPATVGGPMSFMFDFSRSKPAYSSYTVSYSMFSSEVGVVPNVEGSTIADVSTCSGVRSLLPSSTTAVSMMDREARVLRYREKRKNRKFEKTIRYASRKAYAETRPRINGRFAKRTEVDAEVDLIYSSAVNGTTGFMVADHGYGVVPSF